MTARLTSALALTALLAGAVPAAAAPPPPAAPAPWEGAPFAADPKALLAAAEALTPPKGTGIDVLVEEALYRLDARGAATFTYRLVFRPLSAEAARTWSRLEGGYAPWHQAKPEIRARVVTPDGAVHELDPATLVEQGVGDSDEMYSDRRVVAGPLPAVRAGAVVEEVITVRDLAPFFDAGTVYRYWFGQPHPIRVSRLRIEAPASLPLAHVVRGIELAPMKKVENGVRTLLFEKRDLAAATTPVPYAPHEKPPGAYVAFSTGASWAEVSARYAAVAAKQLAGADLGSVAKTAAAGASGRDATIRKIVAWIHENVRYTGLEFGDAALVPAPPGETLKRRYGDCKDLSLLLAGLLHEVGIDARLALLRTRWHELSPALPGMGDFDHAIVRVEGSPPLWIDPTDPYTPPGALPAVDQGRLALVIAPGTKDLVPTPAPGPEANEATTTREVFLAEAGPGRVVETRELRGALATAERAFRDRMSASHRREIDEKYATEVFRAKTHAGTTVEGLEDSAAPLRIRVEALESSVVATADDEAEIPVSPDPVFEPLPPVLTGRGEDPKDKAQPPARTADVVLQLPYRWEIVYRIVPPVGFRARPLPQDATRRFGAASFTERYALEPDGAVTARFRFDTGGRVLSAGDADALGKEVRKRLRGADPVVSFERIGAALLAAGRVSEALAEMQRLAKLHPAEAMHHVHLGLALLQLGYRDAAAAEVRRGIALEPDRAWAHRVLGWVLEHDAVGRRHGPGFDHAGAIAEYRKARALEPKHVGGRGALAELLAHDPGGLRFGKGAKLDQAIAEYRSIRDELDDKSHDPGLLATLFAAGKSKDAAELAREMRPSPERDAILVAAVALGTGVDDAVAEAEKLDDKRRALREAGALLVRQRRYPLASALAAAAARGAPNAAELRAQADTWGDLKRWETLPEAPDEATRLVRRLFVAVLASPDADKAVVPLLSKRLLDPKGRPTATALPLPVAGARGSVRDSGTPPDVLLDLVLSKLEVVKDGDPAGGVRVRVQLPFAPSDRGSTLFLVREGGKLVLAGSDAVWPALGDEALRRAEAKDLAGARRWLEWARDAVPPGDGDDGAPAAVLAKLWPPGVPGELAGARRAAAALLAFSDPDGRAAPILAEARAKEHDPAVRRALAYALAEGYRTGGKDALLLGAADEILAEDPASRQAFAAKAWALRRLGRYPELKAAADAILAKRPDDPEVLSLLASSSLILGDAEGSARTWRRIIDSGKATAGVYNDAAWLGLLREPVPPESLDWARRAVDRDQGHDSATLNTLAAIYAASGKPSEAREIFIRSLEASGVREPDGSDWYVFGRIAEDWGLTEAAAAAYRRIAATDEKDPSSAYALARVRLARLDQPVPAAGGPPATPAKAPAAAEGGKERAPR